jgi:hypothetical protein
MMRAFSLVRLPAVLLLAASSVGAAAQAPAAAPTPVAVYKSATCGCCAKWNTHMSDAKFNVTSTDVPDVAAVKDKHGVPANLRSCHTAIVGGYVIEGHVPADVIKKLLRERPADVVGIAVPGMPTGSPGMEDPAGKRVDSYNVMSFDKNGATKVYASR